MVENSYIPAKVFHDLGKSAASQHVQSSFLASRVERRPLPAVAPVLRNVPGLRVSLVLRLCGDSSEVSKLPGFLIVGFRGCWFFVFFSVVGALMVALLVQVSFLIVMASTSRHNGDTEDEIFRFQIEEEDLEEVAVITGRGDDGIDDRWCLVGRFLSNRLIDFEKMQNILASLWQPGMGMFVKQLDNNRFLFQFYHEVDIQKVINGSPWTYDRMQLIIERLRVGGDPKALPLNTLHIWVQLHDMEPGCMAEVTAAKVGNTMGKYIESDPKNFIGVWRAFLRIRVTLSIDKPLRPRMKLTKDDGSWFWINFKYERPLTFCFICGIIGHSERFCHKLFHQPIEQIVKPYGEFMRALPQKSYKNIGSRWLRTRGWSPPTEIGGVGPEGMESPTVNGGGPLVGGDAVNVGVGPMPSHVNGGGVVMAQSFSHGPRVNQGDVSQNRGKDVVHSSENALVVTDNKKGKPSVVFLCETLSNQSKMDRVCMRLGFGGCFVVAAQGRSGGLALLWKNQEDVKVESFSTNHIDSLITLDGQREFQFTGIYGEPNRSLRKNTWDLLRTLHRRSTAPWCLMGDFNNVLCHGEKFGGLPYPSWLIDGFQEVVQQCGLIDLDLCGHPFTWEKSRDTAHWIEARLDRAMVSNSWLNNLSSSKLFNLEISPSDHSPLLLDVLFRETIVQARSFKFENFWVSHPDCEDVVRRNWSSLAGQNIGRKIQECGTALQQWGKDVFGKFSSRIKQCNRLLKQYKKRRDEDGNRLFYEAKKELFAVLSQREVFWRQRSKQLWLQAGDQNSKFFHSKASARKRNNHITMLKDSEGNFRQWDNGLENVVVEYYKEIFNAEPTCWEEVLDCVVPTVRDEHNEALLRPILDQEVKEAVFQMHPD
uniref:CCHC-type domain-containing protein n=1 Tax=Cannabis sativa TaxID=3483 RepID=A0A803QRE7_CANSA